MDFLKPLSVPPPMAQSLRFGNYFFSYPELLAGVTIFDTVLPAPGLYVILVFDAGWTPLPYRPLYFGESENIRSRATPSHENYSSWKRAGGTATLYRAFHYMNGSIRAQRQAVESALIAHYGTPCNQRLSFSLEGLLGRI